MPVTGSGDLAISTGLLRYTRPLRSSHYLEKLMCIDLVFSIKYFGKVLAPIII